MPLRILGPLVVLGLASPAGAAQPVPADRHAAGEIIQANDNRHAAGRLRGGVLRVSLEARTGRWFPEGRTGPWLEVAAFAADGRRPSVPGPLLRVPLGTEVQVRLRNGLTQPMLVRGLHGHDGARDSVDLAPGETREVRFRATTPGTHYYHGRTTGNRQGMSKAGDGQLVGAFVVDPPATPRRPGERVMVIGMWEDPTDTVTAAGHHKRETIVVNGLSWPHTERLLYTVGDSVRWRVVNASTAPHPMHLHGFYFDVDSRGDAQRDTLYGAGERRTVVTEFLPPGTSMAMTWVPKRPGNWLFHCHLIAHVSTQLRLAAHGAHAPRHRMRNHATDGMAALVMGIHVRPRRGAPPVTEQAPRRRLRAFINGRPGHFGDQPGFGFVLQEGPHQPAPDSMRMPGSTVVLTRGEPVEIAVHNRSPEMVTVHWHGIELDSYFDGVGDWSGDPMRVAPPIAPGDSFVVRMTPDRAGTFIYHTHMEEGQQLNSGLYGPLIVLEPGERLEPERDHIFLLGWYGPGPNAPAALNGDPTPAPLRFAAGTTHRLRFINITPSQVERVSLLAGDTLQRWRAFAKDGALLPPHQATEREARQVIGPGETYDFEFTPREARELLLQLQVARRAVIVSDLRVPIRVH